jgi:hypothetical protein
MLHPTPRWRDAVAEQVRIVGLNLRREALAAAVVLVVASLPVLIDLGRGGPGLDSGETFPTSVFSFLLPFAVWRGERRFGPDFLWTLPVDRRQIALARVIAGWVWLMAAVGAFVIWLLALALLANASSAETLMRVPIVATTAMYMFGSALVLGFRHPLRWLLGTVGVCFLLGMFADAMGYAGTGEWRIVAGSSVLRSAVYGPYGLRTLLDSSGFVFAARDSRAAWQTVPDLAQWATATFLWLGAGLIALWAAISRHGEHRRQ